MSHTLVTNPAAPRRRVWPWLLLLGYGGLLAIHLASGFDLESFLQSGVRIATPLLLAALGELIVEKAGLINIGIEGIVLVGAFGGFAAAYQLESLYLGVIAGMFSGLLLAALFGLLCVTLRNDQIVVGAALNFIAIGATGLLYQIYYASSGSAHTLTPFGEIGIPGLERIPLLGPAFFSQTVLTYLAFLLVLLFVFLKGKTRLGFHLEAVGEHPRAADAAGIPVGRVRWFAVLIEGLLGGLAGASLSLASSNTFNEEMSNGRGYIALAIVIFGRWNPLGIFGAALFFGVATALQLALQATDIEALKANYPYLQMLPYLLTLLVLTFSVGRARAPSEMGKHYHRE
ncbi:MAG: ABC transporter permease [Candidatus Omnitrophica bacterium]|nr:ABC transporter permease [Candidatus Omnitrophota bacterium]